MEHDLVGRVLEGTENIAFALVRVVEHRQRVVGMGRHDDRVEPLGRAGLGADRDPSSVARTLTTGSSDRTAPSGSSATMRFTYSIEPPRTVRHWSVLPTPIRPWLSRKWRR